MSLPTILATAVAAAATVGVAATPAMEVTAPAVSSLIQLNPVAGPLPQLAATSTFCDGKTLRRTLVRSVAGPLNISTLASTEAQQITTSSSQGSTELLIVTFSGAVIKSGANSVAAAIKVDGAAVEPTDHGYTSVLDSSSWGAAAISMTRCLRVRPGKHSVSVALGANLGGPAYVREYTIRIDQYN